MLKTKIPIDSQMPRFSQPETWESFEGEDMDADGGQQRKEQFQRHLTWNRLKKAFAFVVLGVILLLNLRPSVHAELRWDTRTYQEHDLPTNVQVC